MFMKSSINRCCDALLSKFNFEKQQRRKQILQKKQQVNEVRIFKERVVVEIFACKRCSIKYSNNIQLHKHIEKHHIKKVKNAKFELFTSIFTSNINSFFASVQNHKTSISSSSSPKKSLIMSFLTIMLNQAFVTSISITFIKLSITFLTSSQIT